MRRPARSRLRTKPLNATTRCGVPRHISRADTVWRRMARIPINIAEHVGKTPMIELTRMAAEGVRVFAKLEAYNPGGSVKDRIGVAMIEAAEAEGRIEPGRTTIVEATSGNTGIALAFVCAAKGYELVLTLPQGMSRERKGLLRLYGARVEDIESLGGMDEAIAAARTLAGGDDAFLPDQFSNPANPEIHRRTTGPEMFDALDGGVDVLVAGVGTGGTITGVGEVLKERNPERWSWRSSRRRRPCSSGGSPGPHKIQGIGAGFVPAVLNREVIDEIIAGRRRGRDRDGARAAAAARGCSSASPAAPRCGRRSRSAARPESKGKRIAVVLPDSGERYVSTPFFAP